MSMNGIAKVVLVFRSSYCEINRRSFEGVFAYARQAGWNIHTIEYARAASTGFVNSPSQSGIPDVRQLLAFWRPAGCIVENSVPPWSLDTSAFRNVPTVFFEGDPRTLPRNAICVLSDDESIAACAARELVALNLNCYGFIPLMIKHERGRKRGEGRIGAVREVNWSRDRRVAFERLMRMGGKKVRIFRDGIPVSDTVPLIRQLGKWLASLPKPCGIFAANDNLAVQVVAACKEMDIPVPDDVAVVGVDDNVPLCENTSPTLSSVRPDNERCGWMAAELLDGLLSSNARLAARGRRFGVASFVRRESSFRQPSIDARVRRAIEFVRRNACAGVEPPQVIAEMGCSRSLANLRFRQATGHTILDEIHTVRLARVKELMLKPTLDVASIPDFCGYASLTDLRRVFKQRVGCTMRQFRNSRKTLFSP